MVFLINIYYLGQYVGNATQQNIQIVKNLNTITFNATLSGVGNTLVNDFIMNSSLVFQCTGSVDLTGTNAANLPQLFNTQITIAGLDHLPIDINSFSILNITQTQIFMNVLGDFNNTSLVNVTFSTLNLYLYYKEAQVGIISVENLEIVPGLNPINVEAIINGTGNSIVQDFMNLSTLSFVLNGYVQIQNNTSTQEFLFTRQLQLNGLTDCH